MKIEKLSKLREVEFLVCTKKYVDVYGSYYERCTQNGKYLVHLEYGKKYRIGAISSNQICVTNEIGHRHWYDLDRFETIKDFRRMKIQKINKVNGKEI